MFIKIKQYFKIQGALLVWGVTKDGDQMAVLIPVTSYTRWEAKLRWNQYVRIQDGGIFAFKTTQIKEIIAWRDTYRGVSLVNAIGEIFNLDYSINDIDFFTQEHTTLRRQNAGLRNRLQMVLKLDFYREDKVKWVIAGGKICEIWGDGDVRAIEQPEIKFRKLKLGSGRKDGPLEFALFVAKNRDLYCFAARRSPRLINLTDLTGISEPADLDIHFGTVAVFRPAGAKQATVLDLGRVSAGNTTKIVPNIYTADDFVEVGGKKLRCGISLDNRDRLARINVKYGKYSQTNF